MEQIVAMYRANDLILARIKIVRNFWRSQLSLIFKRDFPGIDGLLFRHCKFAITLGLKFAVDLIYLDYHKKIILISEVLVPNKFGPYIPDAYYLLEVPAGTAAAKNMKIGEQMQW